MKVGLGCLGGGPAGGSRDACGRSPRLGRCPVTMAVWAAWWPGCVVQWWWRGCPYPNLVTVSVGRGENPLCLVRPPAAAFQRRPLLEGVIAVSHLSPCCSEGNSNPWIGRWQRTCVVPFPKAWSSSPFSHARLLLIAVTLPWLRAPTTS